MNEKILKILLEDSRLSADKIAVMLGEKKEDVAAAIRQMESDGTILKYTAVINDDAIKGEHAEALIEVKVTPSASSGFESIAGEISKFSEVKSVSLMSGGFDLAVIVEARNLREVAMFVVEKLAVIDKVLSTATHFILKRYKTEGVITSAEENKRIAIHV